MGDKTGPKIGAVIGARTPGNPGAAGAGGEPGKGDVCVPGSPTIGGIIGPRIGAVIGPRTPPSDNGGGGDPGGVGGGCENGFPAMRGMSGLKIGAVIGAKIDTIGVKIDGTKFCSNLADTICFVSKVIGVLVRALCVIVRALTIVFELTIRKDSTKARTRAQFRA